MRRRESAISCVALVVAALLSGCGGGHAVHTSSSDMRSQATVTSSATPPNSTATQPAVGAYWPYEKLIAHLAGRGVALGSGTVHLNPALLECNGNGAALKTGTTPRWSRYTCTQTIFQGGADHDVTFDVVISGPTQLTISSPRTGPE